MKRLAMLCTVMVLAGCCCEAPAPYRDPVAVAPAASVDSRKSRPVYVLWDDERKPYAVTRWNNRIEVVGPIADGQFACQAVPR